MKVEILGIGIDNLSELEVVNRVHNMWSDGKKHYLVTPNPEFLVYSQGNSGFKEILNNADLALPDGIGLIWSARLLGRQITERITGADFAVRLIEEASNNGKSVFFLGGRQGVSKIVAEKFKIRFPKLIVAGVEEGESSADGDIQIRKVISTQHIDLLLIAYGHPRQEFWIKRNLPDIDVSVAMGVGGAFDYWSGRISRAPVWVRKLGFEWLYRLAKEPWRIRRQLALLVFVTLIIKEKLGLK